MLLYLLLVAALATAFHGLARRTHLLPAGPRSQQDLVDPGASAIVEAKAFLLFAAPALAMAGIERRSFARYGLTARRMIPDLGAGLFWGFAGMSALVGALYIFHGIAFAGLALQGAAARSYGLEWAGVFLLVGLAEEFIFRGYLLYTVARGASGIARTMYPRTMDAGHRHSHAIGFGVAATLFSILIFMLLHIGNDGETFAGILAVGLAGAVFAFSLYRTGSLWWGVGMHTSWDWAQSYFYGTPDSGNVSAGHLLATHPVGAAWLSGGPDGPEGSLLAIPALLLLALVIHLTLPRRDYPLTPDQTSDQPPSQPPPGSI